MLTRSTSEQALRPRTSQRPLRAPAATATCENLDINAAPLVFGPCLVNTAD
jgi:hypothetical protein